MIGLGVTIGDGKWLIGLPMFVRYGLTLLWITTASSMLQGLLNLSSLLKNSFSSTVRIDFRMMK